MAIATRIYLIAISGVDERCWVAPVVPRSAQFMTDCCEGATVRPLLNPGLRRVWRSPDTVQFGVDVVNPVVLAGADDETVELLNLLDGTRLTDEVIEVAVRAGQDRSRVVRTLDTLCATSAVIDGVTWPGGRSLTTGARARLAPDLAAATLRGRSTIGANQQHEQLAASNVRVYGIGRLGATMAGMLAGAGLGRVELVDDRKVTDADVSAGGHQPTDIGHPRVALLERLAEWSVATHPNTEPTVAVVTDASDSRAISAQLARDQIPHLVVTCSEELGRIGPLADPGRTACLRCYDFARTDQDPDWPTIALQLDGASREISPDGMLAIATATGAVLHVIDWLCGGHPPSENAVVEVWQPYGQTITHPLAPHASCGCAWSSITARETMAG